MQENIAKIGQIGDKYGHMEKVDMTRDSGVIDSGHYNSPPLEFKLVLELAKWLLWIYLRIFSKNFHSFLGKLNH